jgi:23S rRNA C2498 (ribose-2'-O)-methylase RlmM
VFADITAGDIEIINMLDLLTPSGKREVREYTRYVLTKQYRREVMVAIFQNKLLANLLHSIVFLVERDDFDIGPLQKRISQIKELYYAIFEQVHNRYLEVVDDLDSNEVVREFGRISFENLEEVLKQGNPTVIRREVINFQQEYNKLGKKKDARQIVAV